MALSLAKSATQAAKQAVIANPAVPAAATKAVPAAAAKPVTKPAAPVAAKAAPTATVATTIPAPAFVAGLEGRALQIFGSQNELLGNFGLGTRDGQLSQYTEFRTLLTALREKNPESQLLKTNDADLMFRNHENNRVWRLGDKFAAVAGSKDLSNVSIKSFCGLNAQNKTARISLYNKNAILVRQVDATGAEKSIASFIPEVASLELPLDALIRGFKPGAGKSRAIAQSANPLRNASSVPVYLHGGNCKAAREGISVRLGDKSTLKQRLDTVRQANPDTMPVLSIVKGRVTSGWRSMANLGISAAAVATAAYLLVDLW